MTLYHPSLAPRCVALPARIGPAIFLAVFSVVFAFWPPKTAAESPEAAYSRLYFGLQPPADRDLQRSVELIEELLAAQRFGEAVPLVEQVFATPSDRVDADGTSLKARLLTAITTGVEGSQSESDDAESPRQEMARRGQDVLRSVLSGVYRRKLTEAKTIDEFRTLIAQYPPELFGTDALVELARLEESTGSYATASRVWRVAEDLVRSANDTAKASHYAEAAEACAVRGGSQSVANANGLGEATIDAIPKQAAAADGVERSTGPPAAWRSWRAPLSAVTGDEVDPRHNWLPTGGAIAAGEVILAPTASGLVALGAQSGKRLWEIGRDEPENRRRYLNYDRVRGRVVSDGRIALVLESVEAAPDSQSTRQNNRFLARRRLPQLEPNAIAAYDIAQGGKLRWRTSGEAALEAASFLGPPAIAEGRLYALAEIDQSISLVTLDVKTGRAEWIQPLVQCEQTFPLHAQTIGMTPTVGTKLVYCLTGRGAIAAIDPLRRQIAWIHYLQVDPEMAKPQRNAGWRGFGQRNWQDDLTAWRHGRVVKQGKRLIVVSPALATLEVLDATTGELQWQAESPAGLYLAGVTEQDVTILGSNRLSSYDVATGETAWDVPLQIADDSPAGAPLQLETGYLVPLASGRFAFYDGESKPMLISPSRNPLEPAAQLGDLFSHNGAIYSRSATTLECFQQAESVEAGVAFLENGDLAAAVEQLRTRLEQHPEDKRLAELLAVALLQQAKNDRQNGDKIGQQIEQLVAGPRGEAYATLLQIDAAQEAGNVQRVRNLAEELLASPASEVIVSPDPDLEVIAGRLAEERVATISENDSPAPKQTAIASPTISRWSTDQIETDVEIQVGSLNQNREIASARRSRQPNVTSRRLRFPASSADPAAEEATDYAWRVEYQGNEAKALVGSNRWGERLVVEPIDSDRRGRSPSNTSAVGLPDDCRWQDWLGLTLQGGFKIYRTAEAETDLVWESSSASDENFPPTRAEEKPEHLYAIGPWGTLAVAGNEIRCRELATGRLQWRRRIESIEGEPLRLLVAGDELFVALGDRRGVRLAARTGEIRDASWQPPATKTWRSYAGGPGAGGHLLSRYRTATGRKYRLDRLDDLTTPLWSREVGTDAQETVTNTGLFGLLSETGELMLVDLVTGKARWEVDLGGPDEPSVRAIRLQQQAGRLLAEIDRSNPMINRGQGVAGVGGQPLLTGELHCLDPATGASLWSGPAEINAMSLIDGPVIDAPIALLARRLSTPGDSRQTESQFSLVALDLATGGTIYRNDEIPAGDASDAATRFWMQREQFHGDRLLVRLGRAWLTMHPTNRPAPPRPPMLARVEDPLASQPKNAEDIRKALKSLFD